MGIVNQLRRTYIGMQQRRMAKELQDNYAQRAELITREKELLQLSRHLATEEINLNVNSRRQHRDNLGL